MKNWIERKKYCSKHCLGVVCGRMKKGTVVSERGRENMSRARLGRFSGENSPFWKGGLKTLRRQIQDLVWYRNWRTKVFKRDAFTCQECGIVGGKLNAHHIIPFVHLIRENMITNIMEAVECGSLWDTDNGQTLCIECHVKTPTWGKRVASFNNITR